MANGRAVSMNTSTKNAVCGNCTLKLVSIAYRRAPWFRLVREPILVGMRFFVRIHHVTTDEYRPLTTACHNCIRFYKTALLKESAIFRWLHGWINPVFDYFLEGKIVTEEELSQAKVYAQAATRGTLSQEEIDDWMGGMKTGL